MAMEVKKLMPIIRKKLANFLPLFTTQNFLVLDVFQDFIRAISIKVNLTKKRIEVVKTIEVGMSYDKNRVSVMSLLKRVIGQIDKISRHKIILNLDSSFATTVHSTIVLTRDNHKQPID